MPLLTLYQIIRHIRDIHKYDQNFPGSALARIDDFLNNPDVLDRPEKHMEIIHEMKIEAILATEVSESLIGLWQRHPCVPLLNSHRTLRMQKSERMWKPQTILRCQSLPSECGLSDVSSLVSALSSILSS